MKHPIKILLALAVLLTANANAQQSNLPSQPSEASKRVDPEMELPYDSTSRLHGGKLTRIGDLNFETVVSPSGIELFVRDASGAPVPIEQLRGIATLKTNGVSKRFRYDLLPEKEGYLRAQANLTSASGSVVEIEIRLMGLSIHKTGTTFRESILVPPSQQQQYSSAIARQKICPVSGKPLGSFGEPVAMEIGSKTVFVCCASCSEVVKSNPNFYWNEVLEITISKATASDAALIAAQKKCPVMNASLGSMGSPVKAMVGDRPVFLCCQGCVPRLKAEPARYLALVDGD